MNCYSFKGGISLEDYIRQRQYEVTKYRQQAYDANLRADAIKNELDVLERFLQKVDENEIKSK